MKTMSRKRAFDLAPVAFVAAGVLIWSTGGVFIKVTTVGAVTVNLGRAFFAAATVAAYLAIRRTLEFDWYSVLAGVFYAGTLSSFVFANKYTTAANAIFLQYTAPVYILVFAPIILKDRFRLRDLITVSVCLTGMSLILLDPLSGTGTDTLFGRISGLLAGMFFGFYFIMLRHPRLLAKDPALSVLFGNLIIVVVMAPFFYTESAVFASIDLWSIIYLGVFQIGVAYILFTHGVASGVRSLDASIIGFVEPLLNPVWVFLFLGEAPSRWAVTGGAIIISAVVTHTVIVAFGSPYKPKT